MRKVFDYFQLEELESPLQKQKLKKTAFQVFNMRRAFITLDQAFEYVGDNSSYQQRITSILSFQWIFYAFFVMGMPLLFETPIFMCEKEGPNGPVFHQCTEQQVCSTEGVKFQLLGYESITKSLELFCGNKIYVAYCQSLFFVGSCIGGITFPILANNYGRKKVIMFGVVFGASSIILCGLMKTISLVMTLFFIAGFSLSGQETVVYVYITEISATRYRSIASNALVMIWAASMIIFPTVAKLLVSWRILLIVAVGLPLLLGALANYMFYVESPRWLASKSKFEECRRVLRYMSIYNNRAPFDFNFIEEMEMYNDKTLSLRPVNEHTSKLLNSGNIPYKQLNQKAKKAIISYFELFRHRKLSKITIILIISWFLRYFTYYGIQFSIQTFGFNVSSALIFVSVAEVLGALVSAYSKLHMNRIKSIQLWLVMITGCCLFFFFIRLPELCYMEEVNCIYQKLIHMSMAFILKFATTCYMTTLNTYTGEVYPTKVRTNGYGICMTFGQIGSSLVPIYVSYAIQANLSINPLTNISAISLLCLILTNFMPETFHQNLYDDILDDYLDGNLLIQNEIQREKETELPEIEFNKQSSVDQYWIIENSQKR